MSAETSICELVFVSAVSECYADDVNECLKTVGICGIDAFVSCCVSCGDSDVTTVKVSCM